MATVSWGRRQPFVDAEPYVPPDPTPVKPGPVAGQPWSDLTGSKLPQPRAQPTVPTIQPYTSRRPDQGGGGDTTTTAPPPPTTTTTGQPHPDIPWSGGQGGILRWNGTTYGLVNAITGLPMNNGAPAGTTTTPGAGAVPDPAALIRQWQSAHSAAEPLTGLIAELKRNGISADAFMYGATPSGNEITLNGQKYKVKTGDNASWWDPSQGDSGGGGSDPNSELYFNELLSRIQQLRQGVNDPMAPLYQLMGLQRIQSLQGAPFTGAEDAALTARYMNPLTQARDQQLQQNKEQISAHGMLPTSGLLQELNKGTNANYQTGVALGANDLGVRAVQEKQRRQDEQLQILTDLLSQGRNARTENNQQADELINLASQFPAFDERRLAALTNASQDTSAAQGTQALVNQQSLQLQAALQHAKNQAERDAAWGAFFGSIINNWDKIFT